MERTLPAEWQPHAACWLGWPSDPDLWQEDLAAARANVAAMCRALGAGGETLEILTGVDLPPDVPGRAHRIPLGDIWLRDTGPIFLGPNECALFDWNGWGGKYQLQHDDRVGARVAEAAGAHATRHPWILEGGAIETDGTGLCMTTRQCLLNPNRNPQLDQAAIEHKLAAALGFDRFLWLDRGLHFDHTDGHIDNLARFFSPGHVVCMEAATSDDPHRDILDEALRRLRQSGLELETIPSPGRVVDRNGQVMPASYLNFFIGNGTVVVPVYQTAADETALAKLSSLFPGRNVVGVDARGLLTGGGAFHCITREQPL